jgi:hypothetical protein
MVVATGRERPCSRLVYLVHNTIVNLRRQDDQVRCLGRPLRM